MFFAASCDGPTEPSASNLSGTWQGTSTYFNAPFTMSLDQRRKELRGRYQDQFDEGFVSGHVSGSQAIIDVNFGDTGIRLSGTIQSARRITGTISGPVIGGTYPFEMTR